MNPYFDMLGQMGISIDPCEWEPDMVRSTSPTLPNRPHHYSKTGRAVFTSDQLGWANPEDFGFFDEYEVVEEEHSSHPLALNWSDEINLVKRRPVHRYSREDRFKFTLAQLMGCSGEVPDAVIQAMPYELCLMDQDRLWEEVRRILKTNGWRLYYNRIPAILARLHLVPRSPSSTGTFQRIMEDFKRMHHVFSTIKKSLGRVYFPNLRYVAVRLMERHHIHLPFNIPKTRTFKKQESLDHIYEKIWTFIIDQDAQDVEDFFSEEYM